MLTFVVYGTLAYGQYKKLMDMPPQPFTVLLPLVEEQAAAASSSAPAAVAAPVDNDNEAKEQ